MVLCKHFQQGNCRFGSKCNFEHIDIKQIIVTDMQSALTGKQYPFSCYGPFKDKACIKDFIEDQSFEEIRLLSYEARKTGVFDQFHQQFTKEAMEAQNKMKALAQPSYEMMNIIMMIYDAPVGGVTTNTTSSNSNPFGNPLNSQASSIFGKSTTSTSQVGSNVFGGSNIFGSSAVANNTALQQAGSIFGGQNTFNNAQQQSSIFGQQPQQPVQPSIFGGGGGVTKPSLFTQQPQAVVQSNSGFGLFSQAAQQTSSIFNQQSGFGQTQQSQPSQPNNIFGQNTFAGQPASNVSPFGQTLPQAQNLFAQSAPAYQAQQPAQQVGMEANIFTQAVQQTHAAVGPPTGFFQQSAESLTVDSMQQQSMQPQQQQSLQPQQQQPLQPQQSFQPQQQQSFQPQQQQPLQPQQQQQFLQQPNAPQPTASVEANNSVYSKLEDLTPAEIEAFQADSFEVGKLPLVPPPLEFIN